MTRAPRLGPDEPLSRETAYRPYVMRRTTPVMPISGTRGLHLD